MFLDPRIKINTQVIDRNGWNDAAAILGREQIKFYCQQKDYNRKEKIYRLVLVADTSSDGSEVNPIAVTAAIMQERTAPSTSSRSPVFVYGIFSDSEEDDLNDDEDSNGLPYDKEVRSKDKNNADI